MRTLCCMTAAMMLAAGVSAHADVERTVDASVHRSNPRITASYLQSRKAKPTTSEASTVALLGASLLGFAGLMRRRFMA